MILTPLKPYELPLVDATFRPHGTDRLPGLHLSEIVRAMREAAGLPVTGIEGEDQALRPLLGFLWERVVSLVWLGVPYRDALESAWKEYQTNVRTGPPDRGDYIETQIRLERDGVLMTPDGFDGTRLESYKLTWKSMKKWEEMPVGVDFSIMQAEHFWSWIRSEMAYLAALSQTRGLSVLTVRFFIFWVMGDYSRKPGRGAQATFTDLMVTQKELDDNWSLLLKWREVLKGRK